MKNLELKTDLISAKDLLKLLDISPSGGMAKRMVKEVGIVVNGEKIYQAGKKLKKGDEIVFDDKYHISLV